MFIDSVIPIYVYDSTTKKYQSVGTAVLILHRSELLLITAAHVIETLDKKQMCIYFEQTLYEIGGIPFYLSSLDPWGSRVNDPVDLAVSFLPKGLIEKANADKFITNEQYMKGVSIESYFYQAIGYPHSKNTKALRKTIRVQGEFRTERLRCTVVDAGSDAFPYKHFAREYHIATCLSKTGVIQGSREPVNIPDLHGMSGGLLQKVTDYNPATDGFECAYPSGIILEKKKDNSVIYSIYLSAVFDLLDNHWEYIRRDTVKLINKGGVTILVFFCTFNGHESITSFTKDFDVGMYKCLPNLYAVCVVNKRGSSKNIDAGFIIKTSYTDNDPEFRDVITGVVESCEELKEFVGENTSFFSVRLKVAGSEPLSENEMQRTVLQQRLKFCTDK
jgi:hypothetical protein